MCFSPFRCFGNGFDLLFASDSKADQVKWMNAAGLISIGYTSKIVNGITVALLKKTKNCNGVKGVTSPDTRHFIYSIISAFRQWYTQNTIQKLLNAAVQKGLSK